jgi:hypothetical protein
MMRKLIPVFLVLLLALNAWAQQAPASGDDSAQLRQEIEQLKATLKALEARVAAQEKPTQTTAQPAAQPFTLAADTISDVKELKETVRDLNDRVGGTERKGLLDRIAWGGDYRYEGHNIHSSIPAHYSGMRLQNLMTRTFFAMNSGTFDPAWMASGQALATGVNNNVAAHYGDYQYFTSNLTLNQLKGMFGSFPPAMQQQFMGLMMSAPGVYVPKHDNTADILQTNRLRLKFDAKISDDITFAGRLSMYKAWGDSTGVQAFNGMPTSMAMDGMTSTVPGGDLLHVERAYFNWNHIGGSKFYLSIGRRPSTDGAPMNFRDDEPRGGTPSGALINYQFDGITFGYHATEKTSFRVCYGQGYSTNYGNGTLYSPANGVKDTHFLGANIDVWETDKTLVQYMYAHAYNVADGFASLLSMNVNPLTGDQLGGNVVMRYQPSATLGAIDIMGLNLQRRFGDFDLYVSGNLSRLDPNGVTTAFGGLGSDPFETPKERNGHMVYAGVRFNLPKNDGRTKMGFEFNQGSKYWFNFAQAEDDILGPKTSTRGEAYETYVTHRITDHFIFKAAYERRNYTYSGSGMNTGTPKKLSDNPVLGFDSLDKANMFSFGLTARF